MHRWKLSALAAAALASASFYATDASALALGRLTVQSALGEPLRAEIDLPEITPAEAESLRAVAALPQAYRAQGLEPSPAINDLQVQLQRRPDGRMVLRLTTSRPVNDPFVDLVLDTSWNAGQLVRSYTLLLDPPATRRDTPAPTVAAQAAPAPRSVPAPAPAPAPAPPVAASESPRPAPAPAPAAAPRPAEAAAAAPRPARAPAPAVASTPAPAPSAPESVVVRPGDTAGRLASANRPAGVSLDQMLVAMMRANPEAFIGGNVNRVKSGAVLQMPDAAQAQATPPAQARQIIAAQSRDFNEFRRRLAGAAPAAGVAAAERSASGRVQAQVEDRKPATAAPDKLTLSKGAVQGQRAAEERLAREKQADQASARMAELSKNISELNQLGAASAPAGAPAPAPAASAPGRVAVPAGSLPGASTAAAAASAPAAAPVASAPAAPAPAPVASAPAPAAPASAPSATASAPAAPASASAPGASDSGTPAVPAAPASAPAARPAPVPEAPPEEPSFLDTLLENPLLPIAGGGLLALLLGYGVYRSVQNRRNRSAVDSSFLESKLQPDSFFGASGGQRVDTANSQMTTGSSSMVYSPSQLDAGGDVDPVAEADVYLAYGRDLQAEEILKEALRHSPDRIAVHAKLAEIYAKRQDRKALNAVAQDVFRLTDGLGPDWNRVADLGRGIDPENPLYQPGGRPPVLGDEPAYPSEGFASTLTDGRTAGIAGAAAAGAAAGAAAAYAAAPAAVQPPDLDLDLDLDLPDDALTEAPAAPGAFAASIAPPLAPAEEPAPADEPLAFDPEPTAPTPMAPIAPEQAPQAPALDFPDSLSLEDSMRADLEPGPAPASAPVPLEFDLGDLSLDLDADTARPATGTGMAAATEPPASSFGADAGMAEDAPDSLELPDDPLATKLALAEEFNAIGDAEGARTLVEEVIAESSGPLKARAQRLLADLG